MQEGQGTWAPAPLLLCLQVQAEHMRWRGFLIRLVVAILVAWLLASAPIPRVAPETWVAYVQVPIVIFLLVCYTGKLIIDTFFYNHYQP